jgi:NitT/TauT family transport system permease protein/sulfonate transport system permease protein
MIQLHRTMLQTEDVIAGMVTIGMVGVAMDRGFRAVHRRLVLWAQTVPGDPVRGHATL